LTEIHKKTVVPYTADEMYALVNDIEAYPTFLPWCTNAQVLNTNDYHLTASIALKAGKIKQAFTTENTMQPGRSIKMQLVKGPFKYLNGHWQFDPDNANSSTISLDMDFEFKNKLLKLALSSTFNKIMGSLVMSFIKRAQAVYGKR
jgi:ribosome-associated toxin RatA of RatAB toxin-antitoxin module